MSKDWGELDRETIQQMSEYYGWMDPVIAPPPTKSGFERETYRLSNEIDEACDAGDMERLGELCEEKEEHAACVAVLHVLEGYEQSVALEQAGE